MAWARSCVAPWRRTAVSTSCSAGSGRAAAFMVASFMVAYSSALWACGWSCNNPGYAAFFNQSSTTFDHSSGVIGIYLYAVIDAFRVARHTGEHVELRDYNRTLVYVLFIVIGVTYPA